MDVKRLVMKYSQTVSVVTMNCSVLKYSSVIWLCFVCFCFIQYRSKVSSHSKLEPRALMLEMFEDQVSSIESRVSRIESRGWETRLSQICKNLKGFRGNNLFLEGKQYCSHLKCKCLAPIVIAWKHSTIQ